VDLHGIVAGVIDAVNPRVLCTLRVSVGYTVDENLVQQPAYRDAAGVPCQVQDLTSRDLRQLQGLNIQGSERAIYLEGRLDGVVRPDSKGGDLVVMADGTVWLTTAVLEAWPDWCKVSVTRQNVPRGA
jgi:hypothetical protein